MREAPSKGGGVSATEGATPGGPGSSLIGEAVAPAPTFVPTPLPLLPGPLPGLPGRVSVPPKPGTFWSGMGDCAWTDVGKDRAGRHMTAPTTSKALILTMAST